jgi:hypothetical protein
MLVGGIPLECIIIVINVLRFDLLYVFKLAGEWDLTYGSVYESYEIIVQRIQNLFGKEIDEVLESNLARQGRASRAAIYCYKDNPSPNKYI